MNREHAERMLHALHAAQAAFYAGEAALNELLAEDVRRHVPGRNAIAGAREGIDAVLAYFVRRREFAARSVRMHPGELLGRWSTVGQYRLEGSRIAEAWLLPLDPERLDRIWTNPTEEDDR